MNVICEQRARRKAEESKNKKRLVESKQKRSGLTGEFARLDDVHCDGGFDAENLRGMLVRLLDDDRLLRVLLVGRDDLSLGFTLERQIVLLLRARRARFRPERGVATPDRLIGVWQNGAATFSETRSICFNVY